MLEDQARSAKPQAAGAAAGQWLVVGDLPCLRCEYNLRGLVGPLILCPECGCPNDLRQPAAWRVKQLPVGVMNRQHWPASAVAVSFLVPLTGMFTMAALLEGSFAGFAVAGMMLAATLGLWGFQAVKWLRSCRGIAWGLGVLGLLHVATWLVFFGIATTFLVFDVGTRFAGVLGLLALVLGMAGMYLVAALLQRGEVREQYQVDWRRWRLPVAGALTCERFSGAAEGGGGDVAGEARGDDRVGS